MSSAALAIERVGSDVERGARADAELVAFRVGHRHPGDVVALAYVDRAGRPTPPGRDAPRLFDVIDTQVEVDAGLALLRFRDSLQDSPSR